MAVTRSQSSSRISTERARLGELEVHLGGAGVVPSTSLSRSTTAGGAPRQRQRHHDRAARALREVGQRELLGEDRRGRRRAG